MSNPFPELEPFDTAIGPRPVQPRTIEQADSFLAQEMRRERDTQIRQTIESSPNPDQVARGTRVAREAGVPPLMVDGRLDEAERGLNAQKLTGMMERYPAIGQWAVNNPRAAATAQDDHESLGLMGQAWEDFKKIPNRLFGAGGLSVIGGVTDTYNMLDELRENASAPIYASMSAVAQATGIRLLEPEAALRASAAERRRSSAYWRDKASAVREANRGDSYITESLMAGTESIPLSLMAMLTRNGTMAAGVMGTVTGAPAFVQGPRG